jgi:2-polyprenyl-6-methoxyphenol hydroxylase-like FAD-dependent oxidoreductase
MIVGGGPVGLLTAIFLGRAGLEVAVVERWPQPYPLPRACTIDHEALRILQAAGVMAEHSDLFEPCRGDRGGYEFRNGDGDLLQVIDWNRAAESGWANTNGFHQPELEAALEQFALATPGVSIHRGWSFQSLTQDREGVTAKVARTERLDESVRIRSRWLVGADGANSAVRSQLGIEVGDSGFEADWLVVDYQSLSDDDWSAFVTQYCDPGQPATAVNSGPGRRRFEFMRRPDMSAEELGLEDTAWRLMEPWNVTRENARLERHAVYTFRGRWARRWRSENVFLAGDAAHLMPPFLGQGLCAGIRDARSLTWRMIMVHNALAPSAVLDTYGPERLGHVRELIDEAVAAGRVICEQDPGRAAERDAEMRRRSNDPGSTPQEPPHPRLGEPSLTLASGGLDGRLAPQGRVRVADRSGLFDDVVGGGWQLISLGDLTGLLSEADSSWFREIGGVIADVSGEAGLEDVDGDYKHWFSTRQCDVFLARPDFYVYAAGDRADAPAFISRLRDAIQPIT